VLNIEAAKAKKRVLLVDDERAILRILSIKLRISGFDVVIASGGKQALDLIGAACPDIMLLDVVMPGMDGFEVLKELRTTSELPVIVLSARPENAQKALSLGANDFVSKPLDFNNLIKRIEQLLDHKS
jgi:two-component system, OmpR family, KDP operon response regulator KdpE